jgi:class 3 adenylate cyclase/CHASE2 domain-containing sensor protein
MTRIERRLLVRNSLLGTMLTLVVLLADWRGKDGMLWRVENSLYDLRARYCQYHTPAPTDKLVHVDIDDPSLQYIGQWPWRRTLLAELTDEMRGAGAKAIAFDVLFAEAEPLGTRKRTILIPARHETEALASLAAGTNAAAPGFNHPLLLAAPLDLFFHRGNPELEMEDREILEEVDGNIEFAGSLRRFGAAILPASYEPRRPTTPLALAIYQTLLENLLQSDKEVRDLLAARGLTTDDSKHFDTLFNQSRKEALFDRIIRMLDTMNARSPEGATVLDAATGLSRPAPLTIPTEQDARDVLFPNMQLRMKRDFPPGLFKQQFERAVAFRNLRRFARPVPEGLPPFVPVTPDLPPIPVLSNAVGASSFVNYLADSDGVVRAVELWRECDGWLYPQFGLMLACAYMGTDIDDIEIRPDHIVVPKPDGSRLKIPVFSQYVNPVGHDCSMYMAVPWFGPFDRDDAWARMYDFPRYIDTTQHLPMVKVWEVLEFRRKIRDNIELMRIANGRIISLIEGEAGFRRFTQRKFDPDDVESHVKLAEELLSRRSDADPSVTVIDSVMNGMDKLSDAEFEEFLKTLPDEVERKKVRSWVVAVKQLPNLRDTTVEMARALTKTRQHLRSELDGKAVLVGFTAVGRMDIVPTSMIPRCPGPVVHGAIFNAILTGDVWTRASPWTTRLATLIIGLLATAIVAYLHPFNALLSSLGIVIGYLAFNGLYLFDVHNYLLGAAAPLVSVGLVWSGCTLLRFIVERAERRHIEKRFRSYVDPALVNAIVEHPERVHFEGESREMSVVFTDLAGFTTLSEKLKARTVPILNEYMRRMVNIIRDVTNTKKPDNRRGYRNKFLGDGIMFFFGAPLDNQFHAVDAVATVLRMQEAIPAFNDWLKAQDLPSVKMRAGISTGEMIVGDAGSPDAADYTVLGDDVNLGARLESANKATGTLVMISQRTRELCGELFLVRPLAKLQVMGKENSILVYEPICETASATTRQQLHVQMTEIMVNQFVARDFAGCIEQTRTLDEAFGASKLTAMYRRECENYMAEPPGAGFDGTIVLSEK